jgi:hypothetical protein
MKSTRRDKLQKQEIGFESSNTTRKVGRLHDTVSMFHMGDNCINLI